jgi:hypothetical protein
MTLHRLGVLIHQIHGDPVQLCDSHPKEGAEISHVLHRRRCSSLVLGIPVSDISNSPIDLATHVQEVVSSHPSD